MPIGLVEVVSTMQTTVAWRYLIPAMFCIGLSLAGCTSEDVPEAGRYYNEEMDFSIKFHPGWEIVEGDGYEYALVEGVSPWEDEDDEFSEHMTVDVEQLSGSVDLEAYHAETVEAQAEAIPGFYVEEEGRLTIGGVPAKYVVFGFDSDGYPMTAIGYTLVSNGRGYLIAGLAQAHKFVLYRDVFQKTADSFRIE
jgi:hypothetical protein